MRWTRFASRRPGIKAAAVAGGLTLAGLGAGCTPEELRVAMAGLDAAARILDDLNQAQDQDEDISFGDWLADELKN